MVFVNDTDQPADFLTKFLKTKKLTDSLRYATNLDARANHPPAAGMPSPQLPAAASPSPQPPTAVQPSTAAPSGTTVPSACASSVAILPGVELGGVLECCWATWLSAPPPAPAVYRDLY